MRVGRRGLRLIRHDPSVTTAASLDKRRQDLNSFLQAFDAMLANCDRIDDWLEGIPTWQPKRGREQVVARQQVNLHQVTAVAARTIQWLGLTAEYKPRGTMQTVPVRPCSCGLRCLARTR